MAAAEHRRRATYQDVLDAPEHKVAEVVNGELHLSPRPQHAWLVHPVRRTLEAFRLHEGKWLSIAVHKDDDRARIEPFDAIELDLAVLWADVPLPTRAGEAAAAYAY